MNSESRTGKIIKNTKSGLAFKLVTMIFQFILQTVFVHTLGKQYNGVAGLFTDILLMLSLAELGIGAAVLFSLYKPITEGDQVRIAGLMRYMKKAYMIIGFIILMIGLLFIPVLPYVVQGISEVKESIVLIYLFYLVKTASSYLFTYKTYLIVAYQEKWVVTRISIIFTFVTVSAQIIVLFLFKNFIVFLTIDFLFSFFKNIALSVVANRRYPEIFKKQVESIPKECKQMIRKDIFALSIYRIANIALNATDSIVISTLIGTSFIGILINYRMIVNIIHDTISLAFDAAVPSIGNLVVSENREKQYKTYKNLNFVLFVGTCFSTVSLLILLNPFISLWLGHEFLFPTSITAVLVCNYYVNMMMQVNVTYRNSCGLFIQGKYCPLMMAILNIVLSIVFAHKWGIFGVLIATSISRLLTQVWYDPKILYKNIFRVSYKSYVITWLKNLIITMGSCLMVIIITTYFYFENRYIDLIWKGLCCLVIPNFSVYLFYHNTVEFKETLQIIKLHLHRKRR